MMPSIPQQSLVGVNVLVFSTQWLNEYRLDSAPPAGLAFHFARFSYGSRFASSHYEDLVSTTQLNLEMETCRVSFFPTTDLTAHFKDATRELKRKRTPWRQTLNHNPTPRTQPFILPWRGREGELI
jgi:hypothetical protein